MNRKPDPIIENWATMRVHSPSPYHPPEMSFLSVDGDVYGSERFTDGTHIGTSAVVGVVDVDPNTVACANGDFYRLGTPRPHWLEWMAENGIEFDPERPIRAKAVAR